jgi:serine/threonine-protein kinase
MHLEKILNSSTFGETVRLRDFLKYIVSAALEGKGESIKEYHIAVEVFGRKESFDPRLDPIVRVEASRLRSKMKQYVETEGRQDQLVILIPKGRYVPAIIMSDSGMDRLSEPQSMCCANSVALLPFLNLSTDPDSQLLCDSLTEELIDMLTDVNGIRVAPRFSIPGFKDRHMDARRIGKLLGVEILLEGSVRHAAQKLGVKMRLIHTHDGFSRRLGSFERMVEDPFTVQQDICESVVTALKVYLFGGTCVVPARHLSTDSSSIVDGVEAHFSEDVPMPSMRVKAVGKAI